MPEDINDLDLTDAGLKAIMGDRFHDATEPVKAASKMETPTTTHTSKAEQKPKEKPMDATWEPVRPEPNWMDNLKACAKSVLLFGGLSLLIFYWQQLGLMAESISVPSMCVCTALAGWGAGRNIRGM